VRAPLAILVSSLLSSLLVLACSSEAKHRRLEVRAARESARVEREIDGFVSLTRTALARHAPRLAAALLEPEGDPRRRMAFPLIRKLRSPTAARGENDFDLLTSGLLFVAVLDGQGKFIVRDEGPEKMYRQDLRPRFAAVREALAGRAACSTGLLPGDSYAVALVAVPIQKDGRTLGAFIGAASYPSLARRAERLRAHQSQGVDGGMAYAPTVRVSLFWKDQVHSGSIQPELDPTRPRAATRRAELARARVFTRFLNVQSREFGLAVRRVPSLGEDAGVIVWRAEPFSS
jgi:hypothetical protein